MAEQDKQALLQKWIKKWGLKSKEAAQVLAVSPSKMSEFLNGKRKTPRYIAAHIETLECLDKKDAQKLILRRLE